MNKKAYQFITILSLSLIPLAPAVFFGSQTHHELVELGANKYFSILVSFLVAVGFEAVGINAGHNLAKSWQRKNYSGIFFQMLVLCAYAGFGLHVVWGTTGGVAGIGIAFFNYLGVAFGAVSDDLETERKKEAEIKAESYQVIELRKLELDSKRFENKDKREHQLALAKVNQQAQVAETLPQVDKKVAATKRKPGETKRLIAEILTKEPSLTDSEIAKRLNIKRQGVGTHRREMAAKLDIDKADLGNKLQEMSKSNGKVLNGVHG